jgi:hypothetical protein
MSRQARFALVAIVSLMLAGCTTSEVKNGNAIGLVDDVPTGTHQSGYGDGKGDSIGGGGAAPARDANDHTGETK